MLQDNLIQVEQNIEEACRRAGRDRSEVTLIAVSKTKPAETLQEAYDLGVRVFGENKVQEMADKYEVLPKDIRWHLIGHLQRNKVKYIIDKAVLIHSVDSLRLAQTIEKEAKKHNLTAHILIEVNVAREESKFGIFPEDLEALVDEIAKLPHIQVEQNIEEACRRAGRDRSEVTLIAVSKTKPAETLQEAYDLGVRVFGENKVQEMADKYEVLPKDIRWHLIGHLQRNKVKYIIDKAVLIHSVDSLRLAQTIEKEAKKHNLTAHILIEVNVAREESKFGIFPEDLEALVDEIAKLPHIQVDGLMTIAPFVPDPEENRPVFRELRKLSVDISAKKVDNVNMSVLSMGMTNDYQVAIEEGATMVRVGTGIFGARNYAQV